jgi:hypothetical protein
MSKLTKKDHIEMDEKKQKDLLIDFLVERNMYLAFFQELEKQGTIKDFVNGIKKGNIMSVITHCIEWERTKEPEVWSAIHNEWHSYSRFILYNIRPR